MSNQVEYFGKLVGGQNLTRTRPLFTEDNSLLIPYENSIIGYTSNSNHRLSLKENHEHFRVRISSICLHPISSGFQLFSFIRNGHFFILNYHDSSLIKEYDLKLNDLKLGNCELVWATVKNYFYDGSNHLVVYFTVRYFKGETSRFKVLATSIDNLSVKDELIDLKAFDEKRISFGRNQNYLVLIDKLQIYFVRLVNGFKNSAPKTINSKKRLKNKDRLMIVCCNPVKDSIAYTCKDGVIRMLTIDSEGNLLKDTKTRLHWHQMQITDMCFSTNGVYLYSVGYESVVVRWNLESFAKNFVSNIGYSIKYITCDNSNNNIAITLHNNEIRIISSYFDETTTSLNNLNYIYKKNVETGLVYDPKHDSIVLNGRPGYLQFYSPLIEENLLRLDVANTRYVLKAKETKNDEVVNIDVFKLAISETGNWLVTYEMRDDKAPELETKLKFWRYSKSSKKNYRNFLDANNDYELHTSINLPHKRPIKEMKFSKNSAYLITTSEDGSFKIWVNNRDGYNNWFCLFTYKFQIDLVPNHICTSVDSSMFAINYANLATLWNAKNLDDIKYIDTLKQQLDRSTNSADEQSNQEFLALEFGTNMMSHLLAGCTSSSLIVWNISQNEIKWNYELEGDLQFKKMIYNQSTKNLLTLDSVGNLDVFSINSNDGKPLIRLNVDIELTSTIEHILFINQSNYKFKQADELFGDQLPCFMTEDKRLFILENKQTKDSREKSNLKNDIIKSTAKATDDQKAISKFVQELIELKTNQLKDGEYNLNDSLNSTGQFVTGKCNLDKLIDEMFYNVPSHVLPPVQMIAKPFLRSILNLESMNKDDNETKSNKKISYKRDVEMENSENDESDHEEKNNENKELKDDNKQNLFKQEELARQFVFKEQVDFSFLNDK